MECQCCMETRPTQKCPTEQCTYGMCQECVERYTDVLCPACRTIRFEHAPPAVPSERSTSPAKRVAVFIYSLLIIVVTTAGIGILFINNKKEFIAIACIMCIILILWTFLLFYIIVKR